MPDGIVKRVTSIVIAAVTVLTVLVGTVLAFAAVDAKAQRNTERLDEQTRRIQMMEDQLNDIHERIIRIDETLNPSFPRNR